MTDIALLPCPFCGGEAERHTITEADEVANVGGDVISCTKCGASSHVEFGEKENLLDCWNRRPSPSQVVPANPAQGGMARPDFAQLPEFWQGYIEGLVEENKTLSDHIATIGAGGQAVAWGAFARAICESEGHVWLALDNSREDCERWIAAGRACAALSQPHPAPSGQAVAVKPLEWGGKSDYKTAATPWGFYALKDAPNHSGDYDWWGWSFTSRGDWDESDSGYSTAEAAKAAAQADYERRILSTLSQPHPADERVEGKPVELTYTNYRGETAQRKITPKRVWFGSTEWHPGSQWLLTAYDHDKQADRDFALKDFGAAEKRVVEVLTPEQVADHIGVTPHSDMRPFVVQAVKYTRKQDAALSAQEGRKNG